MLRKIDPRNWTLNAEDLRSRVSSGSIRGWIGANWLVLAGLVWVGGGFWFATQYIIIYNQQAFLRTSVYIAVEVVGWTAVSVWLSRTLEEAGIVERLGRVHYDIRNSDELADQDKTALREFIMRHYDDAGIDPGVLADGGETSDGAATEQAHGGADQSPISAGSDGEPDE